MSPNGDALDAMRDEVRRLRTERGALIAALEPFAAMKTSFESEGSWPDNDDHILRARHVLAEVKEQS